ncbi:nicotinate-nucleotide adenylyltransferase [Limisphaera sp. VF-2]|jgi:nicotinate-nucleotide adenylyltransferase|uniref:nicotinate-nucleotide adenylyltransferase n=1 Tax=Limisphaera sp. VF-2 TaxID=3400418 RepID=UPI0017671A26|nr:nicotinate-nucleotide adenylyltransferase [Limisphaera sp.]
MSELGPTGSLRRLGLFGGSFDPVHVGHLLAARAAIEELGLDRLFFIPAAQSPFKAGQPPVAPPAERLRLLRLALAGQTDCLVDDSEIRRGGISYTVETLREYARRYPGAELFYLVGADHVPTLPRWREAEEVARRARFVALMRPGQPAPVFPPPFQGVSLTGFPVGVSSSQIRERVRTGRPIEGLVPPPVAEAIHRARLYL